MRGVRMVTLKKNSHPRQSQQGKLKSLPKASRAMNIKETRMEAKTNLTFQVCKSIKTPIQSPARMSKNLKV